MIVTYLRNLNIEGGETNCKQDKIRVVLVIDVTQSMIFRDHGEMRYNLDFINKLEVVVEK